MEIREPLKVFMEACEQVLRDNDYKKGWQSLGLFTLIKYLRKEQRELEVAYDQFIFDSLTEDKKELEQLQHEACDVANYAMMIYDTCQELLEEEIE